MLKDITCYNYLVINRISEMLFWIITLFAHLFSLGLWLSTATSLSTTKTELRPRTGRKANQLELCAAARVVSTVNSALRKETDMMAYIRYERKHCIN